MNQINCYYNYIRKGCICEVSARILAAWWHQINSFYFYRRYTLHTFTIPIHVCIFFFFKFGLLYLFHPLYNSQTLAISLWDSHNWIKVITKKYYCYLQLTPEDEERRKRRRERNKIAATKCRLKKREKTNILVTDCEHLEKQNNTLKSQVQVLETELHSLVDMFNRHGPTCLKQTACPVSTSNFYFFRTNRIIAFSAYNINFKNLLIIDK